MAEGTTESASGGATRRRSGVRWGRVTLVVFAILLINVPFAAHAWTLHRAATDGVHVTATVVSVSPAGHDAVITFRLPKAVDDKQVVRSVKTDHAVGEDAVNTRQLDVQVLKGNPGAFHVDGQVNSRAPLILTLVADAALALVLLLSWRLGGRIRRPTLVGVALEDFQSGVEGSLLDKQPDGTYVVNGEVGISTDPSTVVLVLRDRDVEIHLRDHENPIPVGERATVRTQLVG
jgi:hypothetical protein